VNKKQIVAGDRWQVTRPVPQGDFLVTRHLSRVTRSAFTLIEVMVVVVLLSLIVIALMAVFNSTQAAFRASVTQTDVLESGRAAMDLITGDLRAMAQSMDSSNRNTQFSTVNFYVGTNYYEKPPLIQSLVASSGSRTNVQQDIFILSRGNLNGVPTWTGTGYAVCLSPSNTYSLYRFSTNRPVAQSGSASNLFNVDFLNFRAYPNSGNYSHLLDGVVNFQVRAFDASGALILTNRTNIRTNTLWHRSKTAPCSAPNRVRPISPRRRPTTAAPFICRASPAICTSSASAWPSRMLTPRFTNENQT
jgi:type II secretory pathway pseudopilin PulG